MHPHSIAEADHEVAYNSLMGLEIAIPSWDSKQQFPHGTRNSNSLMGLESMQFPQGTRNDNSLRGLETLQVMHLTIVRYISQVHINAVVPFSPFQQIHGGWAPSLHGDTDLFDWSLPRFDTRGLRHLHHLAL